MTINKNKNPKNLKMTEQKSKSEQKFFENRFDELKEGDQTTVSQSGKLKSKFVSKLRLVSEPMLNKLDECVSARVSGDYSVYSGTSGNALLYFLIAIRRKNASYLKKSHRLLQSCVNRLKYRGVSFLTGDAGPLALAYVVHQRLGMPDEAMPLLQRVKDMLPSILSLESDFPDELLYGRAGYLYALLFVEKYGPPGSIDPSLIKEVVSVILESGKKRSAKERRAVPLTYMWNGKYYLGAAHGLAGILYMLLKARAYMSKSDLHDAVWPTLDYLHLQRLPAGNFPVACGGAGSGRLVQWCHGAPGFTDLFALAFQVYKDERYLKTALECGDLVWRQGILTKGYGLCHGVAGNAYTFLTLFKVTREPMHLHRACKFVEWCKTYGTFQTRNPDRPLSLFEGVAGVVYLMIDIEDPNRALFPGFGL